MNASGLSVMPLFIACGGDPGRALRGLAVSQRWDGRFNASVAIALRDAVEHYWKLGMSDMPRRGTSRGGVTPCPCRPRACPCVQADYTLRVC